MEGEAQDMNLKHVLEAKESWSGYVQRLASSLDDTNQKSSTEEESFNDDNRLRRNLKNNTQSSKINVYNLQSEYEKKHESKLEKSRAKATSKRKKAITSILSDNGYSIQPTSVYGMMIDAGSTGSRMHVYGFNPRTLLTLAEVESTVEGQKLSYPGTDTRWTDRLRPGLSDFASIQDSTELKTAIAEYLTPLLEFVKSVLDSKKDSWHTFPIYLKATAGMRMLSNEDRSRIMDAVRELFLRNTTLNPFEFKMERARVISGEEEAIYGWTGVNFLMDTLLSNTEGSGTVLNPQLTYGALDLGGGSTQISFYEDRSGGGTMSNLFKLQIGAAKHWNVYAHSFLHFGKVAAYDRFGAGLAKGMDGLSAHNPCLPGQSSMPFKSKLLFDHKNDIVKDGLDDYVVLLKNDNATGDFKECASLVKHLLRKESNVWCNYSHKGDCSFAGVYQPPLPVKSSHFGEFYAFSNFYHTWDFLGLKPRSKIKVLEQRAKLICGMSLEELNKYNLQRVDPVDDDDMMKHCFQATYVYELLHNGYGFKKHDHITSTNIISGHKLGWALGSMLYEINTLPWKVNLGGGYNPPTYMRHHMSPGSVMLYIFVLFVVILGGTFFILNRALRKREYHVIYYDKNNNPAGEHTPLRSGIRKKSSSKSMMKKSKSSNSAFLGS